MDASDYVLDQAPSSERALVASPAATSEHLALSTMDAKSLAMIVASAVSQAGACSLRKERTAFEMLADRDFMRKGVAVATFLNGLQSYRIGRDRLRVFVDPITSEAAAAAFCELSEDAVRAGRMKTPFNLDEWYVGQLSPEALSSQRNPSRQAAEVMVELRQNSSGNSASGKWLSLIFETDRRMPGFVNAMESAIASEFAASEMRQKNVEIARAYVNDRTDPLTEGFGQLRSAPAAGSFDTIAKASRTGSGGSGTSTSRFAGRMVAY